MPTGSYVKYAPYLPIQVARGGRRTAMSFVTVLGNDLHYTERGDGPPLLFLHGFGSCAEAWYHQFEAFSGRFRVIAYDSVNHGHSANSPAGPARARPGRRA